MEAEHLLFNGALESPLFRMRVPDGDGHAVNEVAPEFANRLRKNLRALSKWLRSENIECYRLYDADLPEYAFAIDVYRDQVHVQEYA
ncbi:MAG: 23S rRNA (guanine(2445)-N(2))/(guanine(2069)-N(7))-methyltransferase, partial [Gammaproteobacteria bacterium]|nr:23S rRNA (guanine(2445)-N(2))/(guanine(2069)-N(7))-methyltransferase [Gammaproteobacteria bacterium]